MLQLFKSHLQDPHKLKEEDLEPTFVDLKNKILFESPYAAYDANEKFRTKMGVILGRILTRHERYTIEIESSIDAWKIMPLFAEKPREPWDNKIHLPDKKLSLESTATEILFFLCFFAYFGGVVKSVGYVQSDPAYAIEVVDYLINDRDYIPAVFLKGFIYKYGLSLDSAPKLNEAKALLTSAASHGVGGAIIELRQFGLHEKLNKYSQIPNHF